MAMIKCRECGREISSRAEVCPHCGAKTRFGKKAEEQKGVSVGLLVDVVLIVLGAILALPALSEMMEAMSWYGFGYFMRYYGSANSLMLRSIFGIGLMGGGAFSIWHTLREAGRNK